MRKEKFIELWDTHVTAWHEKATVCHNKETKKVSEICNIKDNYSEIVYERYEVIKSLTKQLYFGTEDKKITRFKRAAVIVYAINMLEPIEYINGYSESDFSVDSLLLKQRLAFHVGLNSIIMQYPRGLIEEVRKEGNLFDFDIRSKGVGTNNSDSFLEGVYKDIFYSGLYQNYNILSMANVFLLLTERSSRLSGRWKESKVDLE